ncbi:hypothetical protein [Bacillus cereus]|uniref:hypothetical protein n=1 Tax=Bacillus cereus TaxID=1396 RepID=UPI001EDE77B5|nr:hypothetical protein [Bacillus cereus]
MEKGVTFNISIQNELEKFKNLRILHPKMENLVIKLKELIEQPGAMKLLYLWVHQEWENQL